MAIGPIALLIVDDVIGAEMPDPFDVKGTRDRRDMGAQGLSDLNPKMPDAPAAADDEESIGGLELPKITNRLKCRHPGQRKARKRCKTQRISCQSHLIGIGNDEVGQCAHGLEIQHAEDPVPDREALGCLTEGHYTTHKIKSGNRRHSSQRGQHPQNPLPELPVNGIDRGGFDRNLNLPRLGPRHRP